MTLKSQSFFAGFVVLAMPMLVSAAPAPSDLQCETLSEKNVLCIGGVSSDSNKPAKTVPASASKSSGLVSRQELSGEAVDLSNEFELRTVLGDRTAVPEDPRFSALAAGQKAAGSVRDLEIMLQASRTISSGSKVGIAAKK